MKFALKVSLFFLTFLLVAGLVFLGYNWFYKPITISLFFEKYFWQSAFQDPEYLTEIHILEKYNLDFHNDDWTDVSPESEIDRWEYAYDQLAILHSYPKSQMTEDEKVSYEILEWKLKKEVEGKDFLYYNYPVNQLFGVQNQVPTFLATMHEIRDESDAWDYVERIQKIPEKFQGLQEALDLREKKKIVPPRFIVEKVILELEGFLKAKPEESLMYNNLQKKLRKLDMDEDDQEEILDQAAEAIRWNAYPAYSTLLDYLRKLKYKTSNAAGVWKFPKGDEYYKYILSYHTTTDLSPDEIHQLGLQETKRIQAEMQGILKSLRLPHRNVGKTMETLRQKSDFLFPNTDEGREEGLAEYRNILSQSIQDSQTLFSDWPKAPVRVERIPTFKEQGAPTAYYDGPAVDGSRPGIFYANLRNMTEIPKFGMRTLTYHEAVPGHHLQISRMQELQGLPTFRKFLTFTAFVEGWALYAERLASDYHFYEDPYSDLGRLQSELFRAVRLVVDTGIHAKRWSREKAITYMLDNTGMARGDVVAEIERYIVLPGQACSYKLGMMKFLDLRSRYKEKSGSEFSIKKFHKAILDIGAAPLNVTDRLASEALEIAPQSQTDSIQ